MGEKKEKFSSICGGGNLAEAQLDKWQCDKCGKGLSFCLVVESTDDIRWNAECCGVVHVICPYISAHWIEEK